jgi:hypothetical protein
MSEVQSRDDQGIEEEFSKKEDTITLRGAGTGPCGKRAMSGRVAGTFAGFGIVGSANPVRGEASG